MGLVNTLPDGVSRRPPGLEVVLVIEGGAELIDLEIGGGVPNFKGLADAIQWRTNVSSDHDPHNLRILGSKSSGI
jgi:hypothetical protein